MAVGKNQGNVDNLNNYRARLGTGVYQKGKQKIELILSEAVILYAESGPAGFSMRALANQMGLKISAIQHYFSSREDLLCAVTAYFVDHYFSRKEALLAREYGSDMERLDALLDFYFEDFTSPLIPVQEALIAECLTNTPSMAKELQVGFARHIDEITRVLEPLTPQLTSEQRTNRAIMMASMTDGISIYFPNTPSLGPTTKSLGHDAKRVLKQLALMP